MLPISAKDTVRFTPADLDGQAGAPVYIIAVPTMMGRAAWRRDVAAQGAKYPTDSERFAIMRRGVEELADDAQRGRLLDVIATAAAERDDRPRELIADSPDLAKLHDILRANHPPYATFVSERQYWLEVAPIMAARRFLRGWENVFSFGASAAPGSAPGARDAQALVFRLEHGVVPDDLLDEMDPVHVDRIGWRAIGLLTLGRSAEKNSASPQPSLPSPKNTSPSGNGALSPADGSSSARPSSETRASS